MKTLLRLVNALLSIWEQCQSNRKARKKAKEINELRKNPANWYKSHFGGVRDVPTDADDADKTDTKPD